MSDDHQTGDLRPIHLVGIAYVAFLLLLWAWVIYQ